MNSRLPWLLLLVASLFQIPGSLGEMVCEDLPIDHCAFSISSSGKRCVLEHYVNRQGRKEYQCKTSEVVVERMSEYIETDECVRACGVDRKTVGISSDALLEPQFISKLCSPTCYQKCPNIVDLYFNLAAGEGGYLPFLCENQRRNPRRAMVELMSSGAAPGPVSAEFSETVATPAASPTSAPSPFAGLSF